MRSGILFEPFLRATSSSMRSGILFEPFLLVAREVISQEGAEFVVVRLRFALPDPRATLGLTQPTTHVKVRIPTSLLPRARTFSITSPADAVGYFEICAKVHPGGRVTPWLAALPLNSPVRVAATLTKQLLAPLDAPGVAGARLGLIVFGIGVAEVVLTARQALLAGQIVSLVYAMRHSADAVLLAELRAIAAELGAGADRFALHVFVSREEPSAAISNGCRTARRGRIDTPSLGQIFGDPAWAQAPFLAVGSKAQVRTTYEMLESLGRMRRLLGRPQLC
eukprot:TRINITY_DN3778_c0_g1_i1.p1 TRINITY_DN3778_c0_g1~~TRINITY_DN3778_c0_g1_i1.p1  ORF type:complete len:293 (-),score=46.41 TRINITY_DN3778_c0_g1_i1:12-851(-)